MIEIFELKTSVDLIKPYRDINIFPNYKLVRVNMFLIKIFTHYKINIFL